MHHDVLALVQTHVDSEERLVSDLLHVKAIHVDGPEIDTWPPPAYEQLLGANPQASANAETRIAAFLEKAFRRPAPERTQQAFYQLYTAGLEQGLSPEVSMRNVVEGVLTSPRFLFNYDQGDGADSWALANRLSYFLWNSPLAANSLRVSSGIEFQRKYERRLANAQESAPSPWS